ncbi:MAG: DUF983 domain-containing protein [Bacteroidota bacterium]
MSSPQKVPSFTGSLLKYKCPNCRQGNIFLNKSVFPLGQAFKMVDRCTICDEKMQKEHYRGGGMNYALTVMLFFLNILWYWPIFGISYKDNSFFYFLGASTLVVVLAQPWLMRISLVVYLYLTIKYRSNNGKHK